MYRYRESGLSKTERRALDGVGLPPDQIRIIEQLRQSQEDYQNQRNFEFWEE